MSLHKMDDSVDTTTGEVLYTEHMFEDIMDSEFPKYKADMQYGLHSIGKLERTQVDAFFFRARPAGSCSSVAELFLVKK